MKDAVFSNLKYSGSQTRPARITNDSVDNSHFSLVRTPPLYPKS